MSVKTPAMQSCAGSPGRHRRRGLIGRFHVARTVRVRARRVLGAAAIIGGATVLCVVASLGLAHSGNSSTRGYQKPANPFLNTTTGRPESGTDAAGNHQPPRSVGVGGLPVPVQTPPAASTRSGSGSPTPPSSPTTTTTPAPPA